MNFGADTALGIDITDACINLSLIREQKDAVKLLRSASGEVPAGSINKGTIIDVKALTKAIKDLIRKNRMAAPKAALSFMTDPMLLQIFELPEEMPGNIRKFLINEIKQYAILPVNKAIIDFCGLKSTAKTNAARTLVAAAQKDSIIEFVNQLNKEGINVVHVEPSPLAYARACFPNKIMGKFDRNQLLVTINNNILTVLLFNSQNLSFIRTKRLKTEIVNTDNISGAPELLAQEINTVIKYFDLEFPDNTGKWDILILTNINDNPKQIKTLTSQLYRQPPFNINPEAGNYKLHVRSIKDSYLDSSINKPNNTYQPSAVSIGAASALLKSAAFNVKINLMPSEVEELKKVTRQTFVFANIAAMLLVAAIISLHVFNTKMTKLTRNLKRVSDTAEARDAGYLASQRAETRRQLNETTSKVNTVRSIVSEKVPVKWGDVLLKIARSIPRDLMLTNFWSDENTIRIEGVAGSYDAVYLFTNQLNNQDMIEKAVIMATKKENNSQNRIKYTIHCTMKKV